MPPSRKVMPGQIWSRYSLDGKRRLTGYIVRRVDGDLITAEPVSSSGRVIGPRMLFDREFLIRYYLEPVKAPGTTISPEDGSQVKNGHDKAVQAGMDALANEEGGLS